MANRKNTRRTLPRGVCAECGAHVRRSPAEMTIYKNVFCGIRCHAIWKSKQKGDKSPAWRGGPQPRICPVCITTFYCKPSQKLIFCSIQCRSATFAGKGNPNHRHGNNETENKRCPKCGDVFFGSKSKTHCSSQCAYSARTGENNPMFEHGRAIDREKPCEECGDTFTGKDFNRFCSRKCKGVWNIRQRFTGDKAAEWKAKYSVMTAGENNPNWRGGRSILPYTVGWHRGLSASIRKRDGNKCYACQGTKHLVVHHRDFAKNNHDPSNLITLCQACHIRLHHNKWEFWSPTN